MPKTTDLQDLFLTRARRAQEPVTMFLMNGFQMRGKITGFDAFVVVLDTEGKQQIIYKHAISTVVPLHSIDLSPDITTSEREIPYEARHRHQSNRRIPVYCRYPGLHRGSGLEGDAQFLPHGPGLLLRGGGHH